MCPCFLQVTHRFRDAQLVEDMERIGLRLDGMPVLEEATAASIATIQVSHIAVQWQINWYPDIPPDIPI